MARSATATFGGTTDDRRPRPRHVTANAVTARSSRVASRRVVSSADTPTPVWG